MASPILKNRHWKINAETMPEEVRINHSSPSRFLAGFPSVYRVSHWNTCSTGGDWNGWFLQVINNRHYLITFDQTFGLFNGGDLYTGNVIATFNYMPSSRECEMIVEGWEQQFM